MFLSRFFVLTLLIIFIVFPIQAISQGRASNQKIVKGKVIEITKNSITIDRTTIALTKKIRSFDIHGDIIIFDDIKKGDYVSVRLERNETVIRKILEPRKPIHEDIIPQ